jgi:integrase
VAAVLIPRGATTITNVLTIAAIEALKAGAARREVPDGHVSGLYLIIQASGRRSWAVRYRAKGLPRKLTIGRYPEIGLKVARRLAIQALGRVAAGADPAAEKRDARRAAREAARAERDEVEAVISRFIDRYAKVNTRSWGETERLLRKHLVPAWGGRPLPEIGKRDVHALLDGIMDEGKPGLANRVHGVARKMCGWAVERGIINISPFAGVRSPAVQRSRDRVLDDGELRSIWKACDEVGWPYGPITRLLILTAQRLTEVSEMRWSELDLERRLWTLPRERSKNNTEHSIPLSDAAVAIFKALPHIVSDKHDLLFTSIRGTPLSAYSRAKDRLDDLIKPALPHWTLHDLRRTGASGMARLGFPVHVVEAVLNHRSGKIRGVARVYNRYDYADEKRRALEAWARHIEQVVSGKPGGNVVELATARA